MFAARTVTVDKALKDLQGLRDVAQSVGQKIKELRPGDIGDGLSLLQESMQVGKLIESANSDAQNTGAISDNDAQKIVKILQDIVATVVHFLLDLKSKAPNFYFLEKGFILTCLKTISKSIRLLQATLHDKCPEKYRGIADDLIKETNAAFDSCIQEYSQ